MISRCSLALLHSARQRGSAGYLAAASPLKTFAESRIISPSSAVQEALAVPAPCEQLPQPLHQTMVALDEARRQGPKAPWLAQGPGWVCLRLRLPVASADIACHPREGRQQLCFASMKAECLEVCLVPLVQVLLREYSLSKKWTNLSSRTRFQTNNDGCLVVASFV